MSVSYQHKQNQSSAERFLALHREQRLTNQNPDTRISAIRQGNLTPEQHERALTDKDRTVRLAAVQRCVCHNASAKIKQLTFTPEQHERALTDDYALIRGVAIQIGEITQSQHERALNDSDCQVRLIAAERKKARFVGHKY